MLNPAWQPARHDNPALGRLRRHYLPGARAPDTAPGHGRRVAVINTFTRRAAESDYLIQALNRQLNLPRGEGAGSAPWRVEALHPDGGPCRGELSFVLVIAEADLAALREAYRCIKQVSRTHRTTFGVLIHGARDIHGARRHYRRLAMATTRFLDLALLNLGTVPVRNQMFGTALARLAQALREGVFSEGRAARPEGDGS